MGNNDNDNLLLLLVILSSLLCVSCTWHSKRLQLEKLWRRLDRCTAFYFFFLAYEWPNWSLLAQFQKAFSILTIRWCQCIMTEMPIGRRCITLHLKRNCDCYAYTQNMLNRSSSSCNCLQQKIETIGFDAAKKCTLLITHWAEKKHNRICCWLVQGLWHSCFRMHKASAISQ